MSRAAKCWPVAVVAAVIGLLCLVDCVWMGQGGFVAYLLIKVPWTHDDRLIGTWNGLTQPNSYGESKSRVTVFRANGTGEWSDNDRYHMPFDWGTENGVLFTRRMAIDAYSGRSHHYEVSADRNVVRFDGAKAFDQVCASMRRSR